MRAAVSPDVVKRFWAGIAIIAGIAIACAHAGGNAKVRAPADEPDRDAASGDAAEAVHDAAATASPLPTVDAGDLCSLAAARWHTAADQVRTFLDGPPGKVAILEKAADEFDRSAAEWKTCIQSDGGTRGLPDARFWLADALDKSLRARVALENLGGGRLPSRVQVEAARTAALAARDAVDGEAHRVEASLLVVDVAQNALEIEYRTYARTGHREGLPKLDPDPVKHGSAAVVTPIPAAVRALIDARDHYLALPLAKREPDTTGLFAYDSGDLFLAYGDLANARARYEALVVEQCGKTNYGFRAWCVLVVIAKLEHAPADLARLRAQATRQSCARDYSEQQQETKLLAP